MPETPPHKVSWRETRKLLRADKDRIRAIVHNRFGYYPAFLLFEPSYLAVFLYRVSRYWWSRGNGKVARIFAQLNTILTGADILVSNDIGGGLLVISPHTTMIQGNAGTNLTVMPLSGTGTSFKDVDIGAGRGTPLLGNNVLLNQYVAVIGAIHLGDNAQVMPGVVLRSDVPPGRIVENAPAPAPVPESQDGQTGHQSHAHTCRHQEWRETWRAIRKDAERYIE